MKKRKVFTLIELLVVIAIIAILAAMLLPGLNRARETARKIQCASNQKNVGMLLQSWTNDHDGYMLAGNIPGGYSAPWGSRSYPGDPGFTWTQTLISSGYVYYPAKPSPQGTIFGCPAYIEGSTTVFDATDWRKGDSQVGWNFYFLGKTTDAAGYTYAFHRISEANRATETAAFCDSGGTLVAPAWSVNLAPRWRHGNMNTINIAWLDGHVSAMKYSEVGCSTSSTISVSDQRLYYWWLNKTKKL